MTIARVLTWDELYNEVVQYLKNDESLHAEALESLDMYNGYLYDDRWYSMNDFDELMCDCSPREVAQNITNNFNINDEYFQFTAYGLKSSNYKCYSDYEETDTLDALIDNYSNINIYDSVLDTAVEALSQGYILYDVDDDLGAIEGIFTEEEEEEEEE